MKIFYLITLLAGLGFGSFASVIIHRLHTKQKGIFWGRSKCPKCKHILDIIDLIPIVGCLINKMKCKYCKKPISMSYPILELVMASMFLATTIFTGFSNIALLLFYLFLTFVFVLLSFYDIFFQEIPDEISLPTIVITGLGAYLLHLHTGSDLLLGFFVPVAFFAALFLGSGGKWLGGGDVRIGAIMGFLLGWPNVLTGLFLGYLFGSVFSAIGLISGKLNRKSPIPFGPFLFLGTYVALFWGNDILNWYLGLI